MSFTLQVGEFRFRTEKSESVIYTETGLAQNNQFNGGEKAMGFWEAVGAVFGGTVAAIGAIVVAIAIGSITFGNGLVAGLSSASMAGPASVKSGEWGIWTLTFTTDPSKIPKLGQTDGTYLVEFVWDPALADFASAPMDAQGNWRGVQTFVQPTRVRWDHIGTTTIEWTVMLGGSVMGSGTTSVIVLPP